MVIYKKDGIRTVGVMLDDGLVRGGPSPHLRVLEISDVDAKRTPSDLLPYLPKFRPMFTPLPQDGGGMKVDSSRVRVSQAQVLLDDVEAITQTLVKVTGPGFYLQIPKGIACFHSPEQVDPRTMLNMSAVQQEFLEEEFVQKYSDWTDAAYNEQEWTKVHELSVRELIVQRAKMAEIAQNAKCLDCPNFLKHVSSPGLVS